MIVVVFSEDGCGGVSVRQLPERVVGVAATVAVGVGDTAAQLLDTPFVLLARDRSHAAEILAHRREEYGFDSFMTHEPNLGALGDVIAATS